MGWSAYCPLGKHVYDAGYRDLAAPIRRYPCTEHLAVWRRKVTVGDSFRNVGMRTQGERDFENESSKYATEWGALPDWYPRYVEKRAAEDNATALKIEAKALKRPKYVSLASAELMWWEAGLARSEINIADIIAITDTREQLPLELSPLRSQPGTLPTGDYSIAGLEHEIVVERKSLQDLVSCVGAHRERFEREVQRLIAYPARLLVVEASNTQLEAGGWRGMVTPSQVQGSLLGWIAQGLPVLLVQDHAAAGRAVSRFLFVAARRRWRELRSFYTNLKIAGSE